MSSYPAPHQDKDLDYCRECGEFSVIEPRYLSTDPEGSCWLCVVEYRARKAAAHRGSLTGDINQTDEWFKE